MDRWDAMLLAGAALVGVGFWALWGWPVACMMWGALCLGVALLHGILLRLDVRRQSR